MRGSLILKLMGAFLLVIVIGALVIYFLTTQATQNAFRLYTTQNSQAWAERLAPDFATFYAQTGSWQGIDNFLQTYASTDSMMSSMGMRGRGRTTTGSGMSGWMGGMLNQRLILADEVGLVIADTDVYTSADQGLLGIQLTAAELADGQVVLVDGQVVGTLIVAPVEFEAENSPAQTFLASVNRSILISVVIASLLSLLLVLFLFLQITAPIRQMQKAAGVIARGDLSQRVTVKAHDELGELAASFNHMAASLAQAEDQRRKLIADVAHELRTPLAVIQANTEGMQDGVLPLDLEQVNTIHNETLLLGRLINDLRLLSLAESGELHLERGMARLADLLRQVLDRFQPQCAQKGVRLTLNAPSDLPELYLDADRITQVLNNLVGNALRYTPQDGEIILTAQRMTDSVEVSVTDSGSGIAADALPWIFDRFYRADKSRTRASGGSGLGLAIVRQLVTAHGGQVAAHSPAYPSEQPVCGTRITFSLPVIEKTNCSSI